jgi:hypothetical protein
VQIIEPTVKYPTPQGGYDGTPGKGVGHLFVMDLAGNLQTDITLGEGDMYHPGGIDYDGRHVFPPPSMRSTRSTSPRRTSTRSSGRPATPTTSTG